MTIEEPVFPRPRLLIRQPETPAPAAARAPVEPPPLPTGDWRAEVQQARTVDQKGQALFGHIAAVRAKGLGYLQDVKLTPEQQTQLTDILHSPESPLVTGKWPGWVDAPTQRAITDQYTRYVNLWQQNRGIEPAEAELATGHVPEPVSLGPDGRPFFPRMNVRQSLESEDVAGLRGIRQRVGPRRYFAAEINGQEQLVVVKKGQAFLRDTEGKLTPLGSVPKPQPGALIHTAQGDVPLRTPSAEMLRRADPTSIIDHPVYVLNQRVAEQEWIAATDAWKKDIISGKYPDIIQPATAAPEGWVESPLFGKAWRVDPLLAKVLQRVQQGRAGQARWNVLNNLYISTWFRTFPWGHNYNIAADAAVAVPFERAQLLAKGQLGDVLRAADTEVNTFGPKYQRALELGMAPQHVTVQSRRVLSGILRELGQDPQVRGGLLGNIWGKLGDYQESVPWIADAKARMKVILILEKTGVPFEDAVKQANELIANYWLPSFYAAPAKQLQPLYDAAHAAFTNPGLLVFSPYHGTRIAGTLNMLKGQLGVRGYTAVAGSILSTELVQRTLVPAIAGVAITYWRNKAAQATTKQAKQEAQFQEHRWQRLHVSMPGRAGMLENIGTGLGLMGSALGASRGQPLSEQLSTLGAVARPAAQYMARGALTPSPALAGGAQLYDVMAGSQPVDLNALNPLQRYMHLAGDTTGEQALAAVLNQVVRAYPRYYLPSEYVASNYAKRFIQVGSKYKVAKQDMGVLHNLNLVAGRDLFKEGLLKPGVTPQMYADRLTRWETHRTVYPYQRGGGVRRPRLETQ